MKKEKQVIRKITEAWSHPCTKQGNRTAKRRLRYKDTNYNAVMFLLEPIMKICVHVKCYTASLAHYHLFFPSYKQCGSLKTSGYLPVGLKFSPWTPFRWLIMSSALRDPAAPCEYMNHMKHLIHVYFDSVKHLSGQTSPNQIRSVPFHNLRTIGGPQVSDDLLNTEEDDWGKPITVTTLHTRREKRLNTPLGGLKRRESVRTDVFDIQSYFI